MAHMAVLLLISLPVKDYDTWKTKYAANQAMRDRSGIVERFVGRDSKRPNLVHVGLVASSLEAADEFVARPEVLDAMASAGVANVPEIRFVLLDA
jgi:hypothetical protein